MKTIAVKEKRQAEADPRTRNFEQHSFSPQPFPDGATRGSLKRKDHDPSHARAGQAHWEMLRDARRYLPCHYFDYICGSSTGALIAIMLGRFRMTVYDCLKEYENMSNMIFGKPRIISQRNVGIVPWPKYDAQAMEKVFKDVTARRCEYNLRINNVSFPQQRGLCKTFVTTYKQEKTKSGVDRDTLYLIRSYDHEEKEDLPPQDSRTGTGASHRPKRRNFGPADWINVWEVARAATAAPMYFKEISFQRHSIEGATTMYFSDGGFGSTNNPTQEGILEIESLHGKHNLGAIVSVGTSRGSSKSGKIIFKRVKGITDRATDPEIVAGHLEHRRDLKYWRFNDDSGLAVELDEWKPSGYFTKGPGKKTLEKIKAKFHKWAQKDSNIKALEICATELVTRRRTRMEDAARWEAYATGAVFNCGYSACNSLSFPSGEKLRDHLMKNHAINEEEAERKIRGMTRRWEYQSAPKV